MTTTKRLAQGAFYLFVLAVLLGRAVTQVVSHDENQFIAAGQMIADQGWLPYRDFPYTHMPYGAYLYALSAEVSSYDYLAARLLGVLTWLGCILVMVAIFRLITRHYAASSTPDSSWTYLLGEFALVLVFLYHPVSDYVLGAALNHSFSTFFSLLALLFFIRGVIHDTSVPRAAFWSGVFVSLAACVRLNYASLVVTLLILWVLSSLAIEHASWKAWLLPYGAGVLVAALPALILFALAPAHFYYGNIVYIQLNTLYYRGILFRQTMDLSSKVRVFLNGVLHTPIDILLYGIAFTAGITFLVRLVRKRSSFDLVGLAAVAFAGTLFLSAFSPTPTQAHYFFAPLPFMLIMLSLLGAALLGRSRRAFAAASLVLLVALAFSMANADPIGELSALGKPAAWTPLQVHEFAEGLKASVPSGRVLTLLPMLTGEAGYVPYGFAATGTFSWRTSLLLSPARRAYYGVTSPQELPALLDANPPAAILTGLEAPNAGFTFKDLGGLEKPFVQYAQQHDYKPVSLTPAFLDHPITLWLKQP